MAETSYPWSAPASTPVNDAQWQALASAMMPSGVIGDSSRSTTDTSLQPSLVAGGGGPTFQMLSGAAGIRGVRYENSATLTKTATNNGSGNARVDRLALRLDTSAQTITAVIVEGTPAVSPVPPSLAPSGTFIYQAIARATVAGGGSSYSNLVDERIYIGQRSYAGPSTGASATLQAGDMWYQPDTNRLLLYNGLSLVSPGLAILAGAQPVTAAEPNTCTVTNTSYTALVASGATPPGAPFIAPPSGRVTIYFATAGFNSDGSAPPADNKTSVQVRAGAVVGSGTVVFGVGDSDLDSNMILSSGPNSYRGSSFAEVPGLTPGAAYNARILHKVSKGTGSFLYRRLKVVPDLS